MLILNVKEHPWKLPDGRIALGFTPLAMKTFCSSWMVEMLVAVVGTATTSAWVLGTALVEPEDEEDDAACSGSARVFLSMYEWSQRRRHVLELTQGWPFTVTFDTCFAFMASHCFNLPCLHVHWRKNGDCCGSERAVREIWLDPALWVMFFSIFSSVLWPKTFLSNQTLSSSGLNLTIASLGRWNNASTCGFRWERYALIVLTGIFWNRGMRIFSHLRDLHCHQCRPCDF